MIAHELGMPVSEAKARITHAELIEWLAWLELRHELRKDGPEALRPYLPGYDEAISRMDDEIDRIAMKPRA